jgi:glycosyltransferase involved in cell wall biosynthesis
MRFSFIEPPLNIYGGIRRILELSNHLTQLGHEVIIYHPDGGPCKWLKSVAKTRKLEDIHKDRHEVLVFNYPPQFDIFAKTSAELKVYYLLHAHHLVGIKDVMRTYQHPSLKVACSKWVAEQMRGLIKGNIPVVYGGVNRDIFHPVSNSPKQFDLIFYGSKRPWKGTDTILQACKLGKFSYDFYEGKNLTQEQMANFICKGRVFVSGSWFEGWNNTVLEAMACRMPVVATDCGGNREFAINNVTALVVPPKNPKLMSEKIKKLLSDPPLQRRLGEQAYKKSLEYNWDDTAKRWELIMKEGLKRC